MDVPPLWPTLNAGLNGLAAVLLLAGRWQIHWHRESAHRACMIAAFATSVVFLVSYLSYHATHDDLVRYQGPAWGRTPYLVLLLSHTVLAAAVPFLALRTLWLGLKDRRASHRRWARITFPIWLYVSATGVLVYLVLYVLTDSGAAAGR